MYRHYAKMLTCYFFVLVLLFSIPPKTYSSTPAAPADTVSVKVKLDSALNLIRKRDTAALPLLMHTLSDARKFSYRKGESEALYFLGKYYKSVQEYDNAIAYFDSAYNGG